MGHRTFRIPEKLLPDVLKAISALDVGISSESLNEVEVRAGAVMILTCTSPENGSLRVVVGRSPRLYKDGFLVSLEPCSLQWTKIRADERLKQRVKPILEDHEAKGN